MDTFTKTEELPKVGVSSQVVTDHGHGFSPDIWDNPIYGKSVDIWDNSVYETTSSDIWENPDSIFGTTPSSIWDDPILPSVVTDKQYDRFPTPPMVPYIFWPNFHQGSSGFLYSYRTILQ